MRQFCFADVAIQPEVRFIAKQSFAYENREYVFRTKPFFEIKIAQFESVVQHCLFKDTEQRYHHPIDQSGLIPASVYSEAWAKSIPRTPFSSLRDAAHGKHAGRKTNGVSRT
ncbi:hypothetical protein TNCV_733081 [Trichonephila clavipes]|nr:hypothetical protein TNCV_733081 [Trichonephila clavipes]